MTHTILFMHIPKTGGASLIEIMKRQYGEFDNRPDVKFLNTSGIQVLTSETMDYQAVAGHFPYGFHRLFDDYQYITLLRHPVERMVSSYNYNTQIVHNDRFKGLSLAEYVDLPHPDFRNVMVRRLYGWPLHLQACKPITDLHFGQALINLEQFVVGFTEDYQESINRFARKFNWVLPKALPTIHRTQKNQSQYDELKNNDKFMERNLYDVLLWEIARKEWLNE